MAKFVVDGVEYEVVMENITFAEARAIEKVTGTSFSAVMANPSLQTIDFAQALAWVSMKRVNPTLTFSDLDDMEMAAVAPVDEPEAEPEVPTVADVASSVETTSALSV